MKTKIIEYENINTMKNIDKLNDFLDILEVEKDGCYEEISKVTILCKNNKKLIVSHGSCADRIKFQIEKIETKTQYIVKCSFGNLTFDTLEKAEEYKSFYEKNDIKAEIIKKEIEV